MVKMCVFQIKQKAIIQIACAFLVLIYSEVYARGGMGFHSSFTASAQHFNAPSKTIDLSQSDKHIDEAKTAVALRNARSNQNYYENQVFYDGVGAAIGIDTVGNIVNDGVQSTYWPYAEYYAYPAPYQPTNVIITEPVNQNNTQPNSSQQNDSQLDQPQSEGDVSTHRSLRDEEIFKIRSDDIVLGNPSSKVVVIEYFAYTCYHCSSYHNTVFNGIKAKYIDTNKIAYVPRTYVGSRPDLDATLLAKCSGKSEDFKRITNDILKQQDDWINRRMYLPALLEIAQAHGLSAEQAHVCLKNKQRIQELIAESGAVYTNKHFIGTPAIYINGIRCPSYSVDVMTKAIEQAMHN